MRLSRFFLPLMKENPAEARIASHRLMLRAGMIRQESAGIYAWLPLGLRVLEKIGKIVREEQNRAGAIEMLMPTIQPAGLWRESGRYDAYGREMLRIRDRADREMLYGPTNEEMITEIFRAGIKSYKELPKLLYHVQWKFRDEIRPRFGVMRGREFLMKDTYSFDIDEAGARRSYNRMFVSYLRTFFRCGLRAVPVRARTGPIGGDLSHEFIVLADTGESTIHCDCQITGLPVPDSTTDFDADLDPVVNRFTELYAATEETHDSRIFESSVTPQNRITARGIEVGHIFFFADKYSAPMNACVPDSEGNTVPVQMGSYGIGVSRLAGAIIEAHHDERGCKWPASVAPFHAGLVNLKPGNTKTDTACLELYDTLQKGGIDVLYDDTKSRAGEKFARMDLTGLPWQIVVGPRGLENDTVQIRHRADDERHDVSRDSAGSFIIDTVHRNLSALF